MGGWWWWCWCWLCSSSVGGFLVVQTLPILDANIYSLFVLESVLMSARVYVKWSAVYFWGVGCMFGDHLHLQAGIPHRHPCWVQWLYPGIRYSSRKCYRRGSTCLHTYSRRKGFFFGLARRTELKPRVSQFICVCAWCLVCFFFQDLRVSFPARSGHSMAFLHHYTTRCHVSKLNQLYNDLVRSCSQLRGFFLIFVFLVQAEYLDDEQDYLGLIEKR